MVTTTKLCVNERGAVWNRRKTVREGRSGVLGHQGFRRGRGAGETDPGPGEINKVCGRATHRPVRSSRWPMAVQVRGTSGRGIWVVGRAMSVSEAPFRFPILAQRLLFQFPRIAPFGPRLRRTPRARPRADVQFPTPSVAGTSSPPPSTSVRRDRPCVGCGSTTSRLRRIYHPHGSL